MYKPTKHVTIQALTLNTSKDSKVVCYLKEITKTKKNTHREILTCKFLPRPNSKVRYPNIGQLLSKNETPRSCLCLDWCSISNVLCSSHTLYVANFLL